MTWTTSHNKAAGRSWSVSPWVLFWYCWLGLSTCKNRLRYNLYCVGGDVKYCSINYQSANQCIELRLSAIMW